MQKKRVLALVLAGVTMVSYACMSASAKEIGNANVPKKIYVKDAVVFTNADQLLVANAKYIGAVAKVIVDGKSAKVAKSKPAKKSKRVLVANRGRGRAFSRAYNASPRAKDRANANLAVKQVPHLQHVVEKLEGEIEFTNIQNSSGTYHPWVKFENDFQVIDMRLATGAYYYRDSEEHIHYC